jgi:FKBP-type peptidyl-prolyl cis-trans isomerase SlyD
MGVYLPRMTRILRVSSVLLSVALLGSIARAAESPAVADGNLVSLDVTVFDEGGKQVHSSKGDTPLVYTHGAKEIFPVLEKAVGGLKVGDEKNVTLAPKDAFGEIDPTRTIEVPKDKVPAEALKVGTMLNASGPGGQSMPVEVKEIKADTVILDANHPLAGQTLRLHVKVAKVEKGKPPASKE